VSDALGTPAFQIVVSSTAVRSSTHSIGLQAAVVFYAHIRSGSVAAVDSLCRRVSGSLANAIVWYVQAVFSH
jgi:hypothetical protein